MHLAAAAPGRPTSATSNAWPLPTAPCRRRRPRARGRAAPSEARACPSPRAARPRAAPTGGLRARGRATRPRAADAPSPTPRHLRASPRTRPTPGGRGPTAPTRPPQAGPTRSRSDCLSYSAATHMSRLSASS
eukprot:CAMPEP_0205999902 /NCGR_PEP_ID=MMETSP1464-20131121/1140_1 /ASSEMBLY_ACC=CAM_ASM_001124 /TAXON_ID=119497 /ORGANISM="Exanthemachrysis gayraliae, Strain RCC1523" /LENGTH=132 /DNA_ID=CAMNT_0053373133 /DNA_START=267 /DNA_END=661 /DNA_ORIENTATION=+